MDYKVNDKVWFIPVGCFIAIKCTIAEIDDEFRKKEPQAYLFYWLDEPVGHGVSNYELYKTKKLALEELKQGYKEALDEGRDNLLVTLEEYRKHRINFIVNTWQDCSENEKIYYKNAWNLRLPIKEQRKEWFNIENL
jgi:hypothetical protein